MARKPITTAHMEHSIDRSNMISIQKNFDSLYSWVELINSAFNVTTPGAGFSLPITWQELKITYSEVYFCVRDLNDRQHTIIIPIDMIGKVDSSAIFNLAPSVGASMYITLGGLTRKNGTIKSSVNGSTRLIILAR
jgi:hypothetical protein